jgi:hypothetical protein
MPSLDGGDNFVWIGDPFEGFGMGVVIVEEAIDRGLEVGDERHRHQELARVAETGAHPASGLTNSLNN